MEEALLDTLLDAQTQGLQTDNGSFKSAAWNMAFEAVKACTSQDITIPQIKSKYDVLKQDWKAWKAFIDHTGLGWDSEKGVPTAAPEVLETFFQTCPRARKFRDNPIPCESKLQTLLEGAIATGDNALPIGDTIQLLAVDSGPEEGEQSDTTEEYPWSPTPSPL